MSEDSRTCLKSADVAVPTIFQNQSKYITNHVASKRKTPEEPTAVFPKADK